MRIYKNKFLQIINIIDLEVRNVFIKVLIIFIFKMHLDLTTTNIEIVLLIRIQLVINMLGIAR